MVRNLAFQANQSEVKELFAAFGQLKTVRLPRKFDGTHRGFAFVEFASKAEAAKAMASLASTHLYGRHLVIEYAEQERSVESMRERMREQMAAITDEANAEAAGGGGGKRGKGKKRKAGDDGDEGDPVSRIKL